VANGKVWRQPSVIGEARELFDGSIKPDDVQITIGDKKYFVGNLARQSLIPYFGTGDNKAQAWTTKILLQTAIGMVAPQDYVNLVTGLPIDYYFKQKADFDKLLNEFNLSNKYDLQVGYDKIACSPYILNYKIVPQPFGSAMNYLLDDMGQIVDKQAAAGRILVIDIGYYTLDLLVLNGMEIGKQSHSPEKLGIDTAYSMIAAALREQIGRAPARAELDGYVRGGSYEGFNILPIRSQAFKALARQIKTEVDSLNSSFDRYIVTGGWAGEIAPMLGLSTEKSTTYDGTGNVKGYQKIGVRLWGKPNAVYGPAKTATL
jgi:hypothetical protein